MIVLFYFSLLLFFVLCMLLSCIILIQESKSLGFGASFGGDAGSSVFGTSTPQVLRTITKWMAITFFASCLCLSYWASAVSTPPVPAEAFMESSV